MALSPYTDATMLRGVMSDGIVSMLENHAPWPSVAMLIKIVKPTIDSAKPAGMAPAIKMAAAVMTARFAELIVHPRRTSLLEIQPPAMYPISKARNGSV